MTKTDVLIKKHLFLKEVRAFFENREFIEVQTPVLVPNPGLEPFLVPFETTYEPAMGGGDRHRLFLPTSPEYHLKKALALGLAKVFEVSKSFRNGEKSREHEPEFLMLEWYRHPGNYQEIAEDFFGLCQYLAPQFSSSPDEWRQRSDWSVEEAFQKFAGLDLRSALPEGLPSGHSAHLTQQALRKNLAVSETFSFEDTFHWVIVTLIEPALKALPGLVYLWDYPTVFAALARPKIGDEVFAERFEVYFRGLEIANAFGELTDADEQRARCLEDIKKRQEIYGFSPPMDEEFIAALRELRHPAGGIAVGLERLLQKMLQLPRLQDVIAFPHWAKI